MIGRFSYRNLNHKSLSTQASSDECRTVFRVPGDKWTDLELHYVPRPHTGSSVQILLDVCSDAVRKLIEHHGQYDPVPRNPQRSGSAQEFAWDIAGIHIGILVSRPPGYNDVGSCPGYHLRLARVFKLIGGKMRGFIFCIWTGE